MRFYDDTKYYHFSTSPTTDDAERALIVQERLEYAKEMMTDAFKPEESIGKTIHKLSVPIVFFAAIIGMVLCSMTGRAGLILYIFGGLFIFFGIIAALSPKTEIRQLPGQVVLPRGLSCLLCSAIGLAVIVPSVLAPKIGYAKAFATTGAWFFLIGGIVIAAFIIFNIIRNNRAGNNQVNATCIGYVKMAGGSDNDMGAYHTFITVTPVFEYYFEGQMYRAFQEDDIRNSKRQIAVGDTVELGVDANDPYNICYRKNIGSKIFGLVLCLISIAAGIFLFMMLPTVNDSQGFKVDTMGGQVTLAKTQFDDKEIEDLIGTSDFTIEYIGAENIYEEDGMWYIDLSSGARRRIGGGYESGEGLYYVTPADGGCVVFPADDWEYCGDHTVIGYPG